MTDTGKQVWAWALSAAVLVGLVATVPLIRGERAQHEGRVPELLERLPLAFEANEGQFDGSVRFVARTPGQTVALTADGFTVAPAGVTVTFTGGRADAPVAGRHPLGAAVSRFLGADATSWRSGIQTYGEVVYGDVYPGVDVVFHGDGRHVEHDFVVAPGADPTTITLAVDVVGPAPRLDDRGDLVVGDVRLQAPRLYQETAAGGRSKVEGRYEERGPGRFGFRVGTYDRSRPLVIDPVLVSSTYLGGTSTETAYGVAVDGDGNLVITGYTESSDFPTLNPAQATRAQTEATRTDVFVTKVKADGSGTLWSTYLGGRGRDAAFAVAVDGSGGVYVTGYSESADFPTARPLQNFNAGGASDVFVTKLNAAGSSIEYSTYIGGSGADSGSGLAVNSAGAVFVVGATGSGNFPVIKPFQPTLSRPDDMDGFVLRLEPGGGALGYSSYLGGGGDDQAVDAAIDGEGNLYVTGATRSNNFPTVRPFQPNPGGAGTAVGSNFADAFVAKVRADGTGLVYASYLGGADSEKGTGIAVDGSGSAYVTGNTGSTNFPAVSAYQAKKDGDFDAFVSKVRPDGSGLAYSTYLGGGGSDGAEAIAVDQQGRARVAGATASADFPTSKPFQAAKGGGFVDAFVVDVGAGGDSLVSSTYLGGKDDDQSAGVVVDRSGNVIVVGYTNSADFPIAKPFQGSKAGGVGDAFIAKISEDAAGGDTAESPAAPAGNNHERRVRTLVTITGGLFLAAILQSVWLRRRPETEVKPPKPAVPETGAGAGAAGAAAAAKEEPAIPGVEYVPKRLPADAGAVRTGARDDEGPTEVWGPDRPWRKTSKGPDWDATERPLLRPMERPEEPEPVTAAAPAAAPVTPRMAAPDLWEEGEDEAKPVPQPALARAGGARDLTVDDAWTASGPGELDPLDVWGPLSVDQDPDEWAAEWGVAALAEAPVAVTVPQAPPPPIVEPAHEPPPAPVIVPQPEPAPEPQPAPEPRPQPEVVPQPPPQPEPAPEPPPIVPEPAPAPEPAPPAEPVPERVPEPPPEPVPAPEPVPPAEPVPEPGVPSVPEGPEVPEPAPEPPPEEPRPAGPLSLDQLLDENLPIPEPAVAAPEPERRRAREWLDELLDEDPDVASEARARPEPGPEPEPQALTAVETLPSPEPEPQAEQEEPAPGDAQTVDAIVAAALQPPAPEPEEDFLPPPPPRLLHNLFEPDPDDPLVQALQAIQDAADDVDEHPLRSDDGEDLEDA
jgi:hypothetical protein